MAGAARPNTTAEQVLSRREAIVGGLALAAGSLLALKPKTAAAADGDIVHVGGWHTGNDATTFQRTSSSGPTDSEVSLNDLYYGAHFGVKAGVFGNALPGSAAVKAEAYGDGKYGVYATASGAATGVYAASGGTALDVIGVAKFSRSGKITIPKGQKSATVTLQNGAIATTAIILATLQGSAGVGNHIRWAKRQSATKFQVILTKAASVNVSCGWFIIG